MGAVLLFILIFACIVLVKALGASTAAIVGGSAFAFFLLIDVIIPTLLANRRWFAWHMAGASPRRATRTPAVQSAAVQTRWPSWIDGGRDEATGRPDLDRELRAVGWDAWLADHRLRVVDVAPDPGNAGADLTLYEVTAGRWTGTRLVQVIDASPDSRGLHERHALPVPATCATALEAIAATWGLTPETYHPQRHT